MRSRERDRHGDANEESREQDLREETLPVPLRVEESLYNDADELMEVELVTSDDVRSFTLE